MGPRHPRMGPRHPRVAPCHPRLGFAIHAWALPSTLGAWAPAGQGGTGDPRLPFRARPSLRRHPLAGGGMSPHAAPSRLRHPPKRLIWWMNHHFALAIHQNGTFGGRTATLPPPSTKTAHLVDEPPLCLRHPRLGPRHPRLGPVRLPDGSDRIKNLDFILISTTVILGDS